jgi:hypothetical protein
VRVADVALAFEDRHLVADRRRAHAELGAVGDGLRPHGLPVAHVVLDDLAEDVLLPLVEWRVVGLHGD